jgi:hypothetical protein
MAVQITRGGGKRRERGGGPAVWRDLWRRRGGLAEAGGMGRGANREREITIVWVPLLFE